MWTLMPSADDPDWVEFLVAVPGIHVVAQTNTAPAATNGKSDK